MGKLTRKDFTSDQEIRWCPGCGDYAVLATMQRVLPEMGIPKENIVFISGIGCASRFPYYMDTYGFHTIHGRAPTIATGLKLMRPELSVWIITGDGDGLSIGANHLLHLMRRNIDVNILMLNNQIYGLTKGQYSPTSQLGKTSVSSPEGSLDLPLNPAKLALGANCSFVARSIDVDAKNLAKVIKAAVAHKGTSFIEILQNCNVYNDKAFEHFAAKSVRHDRTINLAHNMPLIFGEDNGLTTKNLNLAVTNNTQAIKHDETNVNLANMLAAMDYPDFPVAMGTIYAQPRSSYDELLAARRKSHNKKTNLQDLIYKDILPIT